jgi:hypothetical protein
VRSKTRRVVHVRPPLLMQFRDLALRDETLRMYNVPLALSLTGVGTPVVLDGTLMKTTRRSEQSMSPTLLN